MTVTRLQRWFAPVKCILPKAVWQPCRAFATAIITPVRFSHVTGHWKSSIRMAAHAADGSPLPWYTYPAIDFLAQRDFSERNILEFGGGQSTLWWSERAHSVLTIEDDAAWFARLRRRVGRNVRLHHIPVDHLTRSVAPIRAVLDASGVPSFDVIVIDGHLREELTPLAFGYLSRSGALIFDDAEGYGFYEEISTRNCSRVDFFGFAPGVSLRRCTSLVFLSDCFLLRPDIPIPAIEAENVRRMKIPRRSIKSKSNCSTKLLR
jgi:hypothetical protein